MLLRRLLFTLSSTCYLWAQSQALPSFEVASIKPNRSGRQIVEINILPGVRVVATGITLGLLFQVAYNVKEFQITGEPAWFDNDRFDMEAVPPAGTDTPRVLEMMRTLLAERCQLVLERIPKEHSALALVIGKNGPKLKPWIDRQEPGTPKGIWVHGRGYLTSNGADMPALAGSLSGFLSTPVIDKTALTGRYDFELHWMPGEGEDLGVPRTYGEGDYRPEPSDSSLFSALQEQLGLRLEKQKADVDIFVVKHVARPSQN